MALINKLGAFFMFLKTLSRFFSAVSYHLAKIYISVTNESESYLKISVNERVANSKIRLRNPMSSGHSNSC